MHEEDVKRVASKSTETNAPTTANQSRGWMLKSSSSSRGSVDLVAVRCAHGHGDEELVVGLEGLGTGHRALHEGLGGGLGVPVMS